MTAEYVKRSPGCPGFLALALGFLATLTAPWAAGRAAGAEGAGAPAAAGDRAKVRIVLAGDSTVTDNAGWGKGFAGCFDDQVEVINLSKGGRSSKSFIAEGWWKKCLELKPDYVLLQFGHNDQKLDDPSRGTEPQKEYRQFMTQYVDEARAAGIKPVLVTSLSRRQWGADGKIHSTLTPYVDVVKEIAAEKKVPLIDLHARSIELYEKVGKDAVLEWSPLKAAEEKPAAKPKDANQFKESKESKDTQEPKEKKDPKDATPAGKAPPAGKVYDGTHLNAKGSKAIGPLVAEELKKVVPELASHIKCGKD